MLYSSIIRTQLSLNYISIEHESTSLVFSHLAWFAARQKPFGGSEFFAVGIAFSPQIGHELLVNFHLFSQL
jgi:hypothetical protein